MSPHPKLFLTGTTGYIGGDFLYLFLKKYPDSDVTCLVRNSDKGANVASQYPKVRLVYGNLDSTDLIEEEVEKADIVYHFANCDHVASAEAISKGLLARTAETPAYWIHTSGTGILTYIDIERNVYGESYDHVFNDWDDIGQVTSIPDAAIHRNVDKIVLSAGDHPDKVKTAIVCPPTIYGPGRGPDNQRSLQAYNLSKITLQRKKAFQVGSGKNLWTQVHVQDLSDLYLLLGEAAIEGGGKATWGKDGYYFAENGEFEWGSMSKAIAKAAHNKGLIQSEEVDSLDPKEVDELLKYGQVMWGTNSRGQSTRGKKLLGWAPSRRSLADEIPDIVDGEAKSLGLVQGHASKVTS